jgi:predicted Zn-dependent protease
VAILDNNEINAFATSGGHIFITRGLVNAAKSEDELAAVIAHEVAHIQLQHSIKAIKTSRITQALMVTGTAAAGAATGMNVNELTNVFNESVGEIVLTLVNNGYSRDQEYEADNTAIGLLASAGYNPSALIDIMRQLNTVQSSVPGGFNRTHPTPANRITNAERSVGRHRVTDNSAYRQTRYTVSVR